MLKERISREPPPSHNLLQMRGSSVKVTEVKTKTSGLQMGHLRDL